MTNVTLIFETAVMLAVAYLVGCTLGYGLRLLAHAASAPRKVVASPSMAPRPVEVRRPSPAARLAARVDEPMALPPKPVIAADYDLQKIKGIGPKIEASLKAMGVQRLEDIASWNRADIEHVDAQLAFKGRIRRERWVEQAQDLTGMKMTA